MEPVLFLFTKALFVLTSFPVLKAEFFLSFFVGYGLETPCGHIDFYPNGGFDQPGCSLFDMPVSLDSMVAPDSTAADTMGRHLVACSHNRGIELYIDSLRRLGAIHNLRCLFLSYIGFFDKGLRARKDEIFEHVEKVLKCVIL